MRETKFRAWDGDNEEYRYDFTIYSADGSITSSWGANKYWPLEQFTGLCDKNGKEIYEGDILKDEYNQIGTCYWEPSNWVFINHGGFVDDGSRWEVVGNIHENPELIKED